MLTEKFKYLLNNIIINFKTHKFTNIITFISLYFGLFFVVFSLFYCKVNIDYININQIKDPERCVQLSLSSDRALKLNEIEKIKADNKKGGD
jgi:hypothetical protein